MFVLSSSLTIFIYRNKRRPEARIVLTFYYWKAGLVVSWNILSRRKCWAGLIPTRLIGTYARKIPGLSMGFVTGRQILFLANQAPFALIKKMYPDMTINKQLFLKTEMCVVAQGYCHSCCYSRQRLLLSDRKLNFMANMWRPQFHIIDGGKRHIFGPYSCTKSKLRCVTSRARISVPTLPTKVQYPIHTVPDWIKYKSPIYFPENFKVI